MSKVVMGKIKKQTPTIQSRDDAERIISEIGNHQREITRLATLMNDELEKIRNGFAMCGKPHQESLKHKLKALEDWCELHRGNLLKGDSKTAIFNSGEVSWRSNPPSCKLSGVEQIIKRIKDLGLTQFLRVKEEVNKEALLADPDTAQAIAGVTITTKGESFTVKPYEIELEGGK